MKQIHDWAHWFRELSLKIAEGGETGLIERAKKVDWDKENPELLKHGDQGVDPFSFLYFLAQRHRTNQRSTVYSSVAAGFGLTSPWQDPWEGIFPTPTARSPALFHDSKNFSPKLLWTLFRQAVADKPRIDSTVFKQVLQIRYVAISKLTEALFLVNSDHFVPANVLQNILANKGMRALGRWIYDDYLSALTRAREAFPGCRPCEINTFLYEQYARNDELLLTAASRFFQIDANAYGSDRWDDFLEVNAVYVDAPGPGPGRSWDDAANGGEGPGDRYPLAEPRRGDVILVRAGVRTGRAIGVVVGNGYAEPGGLNERSRIHVHWINKVVGELSGAEREPPAFGSAESDSPTYKAFASAAPYRSTFDQLASHLPPIVIRPVYGTPLNLILYGPPGTGKTWRTVTRAVAIVENRNVNEVAQEDRAAVKRRFDELRTAGRVEMVTFHQNTTYEEFIEGIRPVLDAAAGDVRYELSRGVFRRVAERAREDPAGRYVLIIDEINRGNVARIFGELITLLEDSKRLGRDDAAIVTLPGSKTGFGVPANLHVVGAMNTADRSIALLDIALRRRFVFEEMMPDPNHPRVSPDAGGVDCRRLLAAMNRRIAALLDREHQIGHTYFLGIDTVEALAETFRTRIVPLLQEYFYDDWEKIRAVLNWNGFVEKSKPPDELVRTNLVDAEQGVCELAPAADGRWTDPKQYRKIYGVKAQADQAEDDGAAQDD